MSTGSLPVKRAAPTRSSPVIDATSVPVKFYVLLGKNLARASFNLDENLVESFARIREDPIASRFIPAKATSSNCIFYKLKTPVLFAQRELKAGDAFLRQAKQKCEEVGNRLHVEPVTTTVRTLAKQFSRDHAYLVIEPSDSSLELINATKNLSENHATLFKCLQVTVKRLAGWTPTDVQDNLKGGTVTVDITVLPPEFGEIRDALAQPRWYKVHNLGVVVFSTLTWIIQASDVKDNQDFRVARKRYKTQFERVFTPDETNSRTSVSSREFAAFYNLLRGFNSDVLNVAGDTSSSLKASNFTIHFVQAPFFSSPSRSYLYKQDKSWSFPIFVDAANPPNTFRKFTPRSDCMVVSSQCGIPFVICEVISDKRESDRSRMLVQAIALARTGQHLLRSSSKKTFFVVALYVDADMVVYQYIVLQTEGDNTASGHKPVSIHQKKFDLREVDEQVDFLREMYNLATHVAALSGELDLAKQECLHGIHDAASKLKSLSTKGQTKTTGNTTIHSITEEPARTRGLRDEDDPGVFEAEAIQSILHQMHYEIESMVCGHPHLAVIVSKTGDRHGYLKFVEQEREVEILQYLTGIQSSSNHTISGVQFWPVEEGTVISMPVAGGWLTSLKNRNEQLWSVALQLVEAVVFMHEHNVAHMDLKPGNVIIPPEGGRLSIIDFSVSIRVRGPDATYRGVVGTEDYIAPEVREGQYKPMLADLWSCGRTLEELCAGCHPSVDRTTLLQISRQLMDPDPEARPKMSTVLERMAPTRRGDCVIGSPNSTYTCARAPSVINKGMRYLQRVCLSNSFKLSK
ncbi:hypothetical protein JVT61DRAFT_8667 [Boletus reticuloceps]|uniref:Protein kinase domain-containing protein n=1 Tax=Boletus reticuloceps TaxID=495285 RepID=A0A8I2Z0N3_9AGAM|nr:hypothetical protein JVT61DRAFT_8667 [Boletus reticuloceps]